MPLKHLSDKRFSRMVVTAGTLVAAAVLAPGAFAQSGEIIFDPPRYQLDSTLKRAQTLFAVRPDTADVPQEVDLDINLLYAERRIRNPETGVYDAVRLRTYEDAKAPERPGEDTPLVGPTIDIRPGQTIRLTLNNKLPPDPSCLPRKGGDPNDPHCFNGTNMHTHGLWVNPSGNGDNVLINIQPGISFQYEYNVPPDHPAGTFWYHPHLHGSTALQVSSGMAGALIIRGDRKPTPESTGDLDTLLKKPDGSSFNERVVVLQQIQYACRDAQGRIQYRDPEKKIGYVCKEGQVGGIEGYDQFGPRTWENSGRYTSINGRVLGRLPDATVGAVERWRLIHAGVRDTINFEIRVKTGRETFGALAADETEPWIDRNCGALVPYSVVAQDGLTMAGAQERRQAVLQPGYRVDALVVFPEAGEYCVVDAAAPSAGNVNAPVPSRRLLGVVAATGGTPVEGSVTAHLQEQLVEAAGRTMPRDVVGKVVSELRAGLKLTSFMPHPDVGEDEVTGTQYLSFNIGQTQSGASVFEVDGKPYDPNRIDRTLPLGGVDEWTMQSDFVSHPFHIHVNPFQIIKILDPSGKDVSGLGAMDDPNDDGKVDPQYPGLKGVWKDTLWIKNLFASRDPDQVRQGRYTIVARTRYQRYIGDFVLHCHILDHEDKGMMQNIRIALPNGRGGTVHGHH